MFLPFVETPQYDITNLQYPVENGVHESYINLEIPLGDGSELDHLLRYIKETTEENESVCFEHIVKSVKECREGDDEIMKYYSSHEFFEEGKKEGREEGEKRTQNSIIKKMLSMAAIRIYQRVHRQAGRIYP